MAKPKPKRPRDSSQLAKRIVDLATGQESDELEPPTILEARASKGGNARARKLTPQARSEIAKKAARARWDER